MTSIRNKAGYAQRFGFFVVVATRIAWRCAPARLQCCPILACHNLDVWCQKKILRGQSRALRFAYFCRAGFWHDSCTHPFKGHLPVELRLEGDDRTSEIDATRSHALSSQLSTPHAQSELPSDRKRLVLCIDDDIRGLSLRKALLEAQGYTVVTANSGRIGSRLAKDLPVDLVVVDYEMPEMDGAAVVVEVRKYRPVVPIIMLSGHQLSELPACVLTRINKFIPKGLPPAEFLSILEAVAVEGWGTK